MKPVKEIMRKLKPVYICPVGGGIRDCNYQTEFKQAMELHLLTQHSDHDLLYRSGLILQ